MPTVSEIDILHKKSTTMATDFTTTNIGGALAGTQILGATIGEVFFGMASESSGGGDVTQYAKTHLQNNNSSADVYQALVYLDNAMDPVTGTDKGIASSSSSTDLGAEFAVRWIGYDGAGTSIVEEVPLNLTNGTTTVSTISDLTDIHRAEVRHPTSGALRSDFTGPILLSFGSVPIAQISKGLWIASSEFDIGLALAPNDSATTADAATAPASVTFSRPRTLATALNAGFIARTESYGIWWRWKVKERAKASMDIQFALIAYIKAGPSL